MGDCAYRMDMAACTAAGCHLWDASEGNCTHNVNTKSNKKLLTDILAELKSMHDTEKETLKYLKHIHDAHWHTKNHKAAEVPAGLGKPPQTPPLASALVNEYMGKEDKTGNGQIYGHDYKATDPPPMLKAIQEAPDFPDSAGKSWSSIVGENE